jgi:hypothetical protein
MIYSSHLLNPWIMICLMYIVDVAIAAEEDGGKTRY